MVLQVGGAGGEDFEEGLHGGGRHPKADGAGGGGASTQAGFGEALFEVGGEELVEHVVDPAFDEGFEAVEGEVDAVVGDAVLGEVVGADFFFAAAAADEVAAVGGVFGGFFLLLALEEA